MSDHSSKPACLVDGAEHLAPAIGGKAAVCAAMDRAVAGRASVRSVAVDVASDSRATAVVTLADGKVLSAVHVAVSDGKLSARSIDMLADGVAAQLQTLAGK